MSSTVSQAGSPNAALGEAGSLADHDPQTQAPDPKTVEPPRDSWLALSGIVLLGGVSGIAYYLGFVRPYLLQDYYRQPLQDLAKISGHTARSANEWALTWIVLFACYFLAFHLCPSTANSSRRFRRIGILLVCAFAAFFAINLIFMYPVGAADLFDQIFRARLTAHYQLNPFTTIPDKIVNDPLKAYVAWSGDPSPYGPAWELLAAGASLLAGSDLWKNLIVFKLLVTVAYGVSVALTYGILRVVRPDWALRGTLFFAWNPLLLFEVPGNGHNDAIMVMFVLAAVYFMALARRALVLPAIMAAALAKFVPVLLAPAAVAAILRDRAKGGRTTFDAFSTLAVGTVIAIGLALMLYAPFWTGTSSIGALGRQTLFTASLPKVALDVLTNDLGMDTNDKIKTAEGLVRNIALALTAGVAVGWGISIFLGGNARTPEERRALVDRTLVAFYEIIFFYLAFASLWFQPWYLIWLVALTAPVARLTNVNRTMLFCLGSVANYFVWDYIWLWNRTTIREIQISSALAIYTLPLLYTLYVVVRDRRSGVRDRGETLTVTANP
ncbi:MAG: hypothetical protein ACJ78Q_05920 [Chloroflexia bacterium]